MPILNPSLQYTLLDHFENSENEDLSYFLKLLLIASRNINRNIKTIETSIKFTNNLYSILYFFKNNYKCEITKKDISDPSVKNIYKFLYNKLFFSNKKRLTQTEKIEGKFLIFTDDFLTKFFQLDILGDKYNTWFLSDTPIAILCIKGFAQEPAYLDKLKLEIYLMAAAGYTLALCVIDDGSHSKELLDLIQINQFSEIHCNLNDDYFFKKNPDFLKIINEYDGYFYLYTKYPDKNIEIDYLNILKDFKKIPRVKIISYVGNRYDCFKNEKMQLIDSDAFAYCQNGFQNKLLRIYLSNIPLYDSEKEINSFVPSHISGLSIGYISPDDFLSCQNLRVKILFCDDSNKNHHVIKYINFDDIHELKPNLYVKNQLLLANVDSEILDKVEIIDKKIRKKIDSIEKKKFLKETILAFLKDKKIKESLQYVAYAYSYSKIKQGKYFIPHQTQIYTAYEACKQFIFRKKDKTQKGIIFQVETGEGKTCIVCLIAAALALLKKTVHVTSSNIKLSIRDFEDSYHFFKLLDLESAVLVHSNELPLAVRKKFEHEDKEIIEINDKQHKESNQDANDKKDTDPMQLKKEQVPFFGANSDSYLNYNTQFTQNSLKECYAEKYYDKKLFKNSSNMNYSVCGINDQGEQTDNKAQVIFSTFVNFESFYLKMVELCPASIDEYFSKYSLLIDEADSILIDEIANGTIISRSMNSNAIEILKFVYEQKRKGTKSFDTYKMIINNKDWSKCKDLIKESHIIQMYEEIDLVHQPEFQDGRRYSIETIEIKKKKKMNRYLKQVLNLSKDIANTIARDFIKEFTKDPDEGDDDEEEEEENEKVNEEDESNDDSKDQQGTLKFKHIVPFSYNHTGILEPNKEFCGFVQQFIAIKESLENHVENMIVNDISMNYLYISHPIFVKLYGTVCGFTGTIGNKYDKEIFRKEYSLTTMKIPRHNPNLRVELPMILCKDKKERNEKIVSEVLEFHKRGNPVLVIFQDMKEIDEVENMLISHEVKYINIFKGKDEFLRPNEIAGKVGAISLGTNVCGRGTNIEIKKFPLHVIISYYSSNSRVMNQAFGRTARQGKKGSYRIICSKSEFFKPIDIISNASALLNEFNIKNARQRDFVDHFANRRSWIFSNFMKEQKIDAKTLKILRKCKINVNRSVAYNYVFPICMNKEIFLIIQEQKIFSLFNCPNSKYTWKLFQRYIRELILESWSLMINEIDIEYKNKEKSIEYNNDIIKRMNKLFKFIDKHYLPNGKEEILETFIFIFNKVREKYEKKILHNFSKMANPLLEFNSTEFFSCRTGFKPYSLYSKSGARINSKNFKKTNFIKDPELKFEQRTVKNKFSLISITEKIDDIYNAIFMKVNEILGSKTFLKLFLRRTLAGCEFGFSLILDIENKDQKFIQENPFCIIDKEPLFVFTIFVRSLVPVLAIILISLLVYISSIASKIAKWFTFPSNAKEIIKKTATIVINAFTSNIAEQIYNKIIYFLEKNLDENIKQLKKIDKKGNAEIIESLRNLFASSKAADITKKLSGYLGDKFDIKTKIGDLGSSILKPIQLMRISAYLLLLMASFIMYYRYKKQRIKDYKMESKEYSDNPTKEKLNELCEKNRIDESKIKDLKTLNESEKKAINSSHEEMSKTYLYKMAFCNIINSFIKSPSFQIDKKAIIEKSVVCIARGIYQNNQNCVRMSYSGNKKIFHQQIIFYSTNCYPSIIHFVGYSKDNNHQHIYLESKGKVTLKNFINSGGKIDITHKLIIAYGIACAMNHLHKNKIVHRYLKPSNIYIDSMFYPYLSNFYRARQTEISFPYLLKNMSLRYAPPEFIIDYKSNQNSFHLDVYSYGMTLYYLMTEKRPFYSYSKSLEELKNDIKNGIRPEFSESFSVELENWKHLIIKCWSGTPNQRPDFQNIISILEDNFINNIDRVVFNQYKKKFLHE